MSDEFDKQNDDFKISYPTDEESKERAESMLKDLEEIKNLINNSLLTEKDKKLFNVIDQIETDRERETELVKNMTEEEKSKYIDKIYENVSKYYKDNNIATVGQNLTDGDFRDE